MRLTEAILFESIPDGSFVYDGIRYDNHSGAGSVPSNSNVLYMGFAAIIPASKFLKYAAPANRTKDAVSIADAIIDKNLAIGSPFLSFYINRYPDQTIQNVMIEGHEGRARAQAIDMLAQGYRQEDQTTSVSGFIVVHFLAKGGTRSRHLDSDFFNHINSVGIKAENSGPLIKLRPKKIFHDPNWR